VAIVALDAGGEAEWELTYAQLVAWADHIAVELARAVPALVRALPSERSADDTPLAPRAPSAELGAPLVALVLERTPLAVAAMFGAWRLHAVYAPLAHDSPPSRLAALCADATAIAIAATLNSVAKPAPLAVEGVSAPIVALSPRPPSAQPAPSRVTLCELFSGAMSDPGPEDPCMVMYTSGSTGKPKGVICSHRSLWHSVCCYSESVEISASMRFVWKSPYQWRTAEYEVYPPLCAGGRCFVSPEGANKRVDYLARVIHRHGITALTTVPTVLEPLAKLVAAEESSWASSHSSSLRHVAAVGEPLPSRICSLFLGRSIDQPLLQNYYGLTETAMTSWACRRQPEGANAPAGRPQPCASVHLLPYGDDASPSLAAAAGLVVVGGEGEIHFAGVMSSGYLGDPALTAQRYVTSAVAQGVVFRTGDLGRWNAHGELEVLGRIDRQIKLHGVRMELGDIEAALHECCREAMVVPAAEDNQTLVAFVAGCSKNTDAVRAHLAGKLPPYMVPLHFVPIEALPRLPNEKVDQASLRERTKGLMTRSQAQKLMESGGSDAKLVHFVDSLGFARALTAQKVADRRLCENLMVLGMVNVILYHWFWCVLVNPRTYLDPFKGHKFGETVPLPHLPIAPWAMLVYRVATQEWLNGVFVLAAVQSESPEELIRFTRRDLALLALYVYIGAGPMVVSLFLPEPVSDCMFHAETVHRWFLLCILAAKVILIGAHRLGVGLATPLLLLLAAFVLVPPCLGNLCGMGGEYLLPTDWWPRCSACIVMPKYIVCIFLYIAAAAMPRHLDLLRSLGPAVGTALFVVASVLGVLLPGQSEVEFGAGESTWSGHFERLLGLIFTVLQTAGLAALCAPLSDRMHFKWIARWILGSFMFNLNFLDLFFLSPQARWTIMQSVQVGGPLMSGALTLAVALVPTVFFMVCAAPVFQLLLVVGPVRLVLRARDAALFVHGKWSNGRFSRADRLLRPFGRNSAYTLPLLP